MIERLVIEAALQWQGAPYIWGAKGWDRWSPAGLVIAEFLAFDCSGLVTCAFLEAQRKKHPFAAGVELHDWRATHTASKLFETLQRFDITQSRLETPGAILFYGANELKVNHVTIALGSGYMIEAAGGDHTTLTLADAKARNAKVRVSTMRTHNLVGVGLLP